MGLFALLIFSTQFVESKLAGKGAQQFPPAYTTPSHPGCPWRNPLLTCPMMRCRTLKDELPGGRA
eukprot:1157895-Pelagomonas_calceolata.AAC.6